MLTIEKIETAAMELSSDEYKELEKWFWEWDYQLGDEELEKDIAEGKLEEIGKEAIADFNTNNYRVK